MTESTRPRLIDYIFGSPRNTAVIAITVGCGVAMAGLGLGSGIAEYYKSRPAIEQKNVCGKPEPETYIERNGVKYYSHIDGRDISDLVKE